MVAGDGFVGSTLGTDVLMFFCHLMFWLMWVNILLGFTNLIPMVPFDGGHMLRDMLHAFLSGVKRVGRKLKLWDLHPMWVDHISTRASSYSSSSCWSWSFSRWSFLTSEHRKNSRTPSLQFGENIHCTLFTTLRHRWRGGSLGSLLKGRDLGLLTSKRRTHHGEKLVEGHSLFPIDER